MKSAFFLFTALFTTSLLAQPIAAPVAPAPAHDFENAIAGTWRSDAHRARDVYRHPGPTLDFFGIRPEMTVLEITPGAGWYTEILAPALRQHGHYIAALLRDPDEEDRRDAVAWSALTAADPAHYGAISTIFFDSHDPQFGAPASVDAVLTFRNVHNWESIGSSQAMFEGFFAALKPGGVLGLVEHRANPGSDPKKTVKSGYLPENYVIKQAQQAGFVLSAISTINANPKDTKDYPIGVWTLPPTLAMGTSQRDKYLAIGESDRMTLRFVKPRGATAK